MDKYEYKVKLDELKELFQLKNYRSAAEIADQINWKKVRNSKTLCMVADVYEAVERYDACQEVLMQAYDHSSVGRNIVSRLTDIAIKSKDVPSAEEYYNEFLELAPKDTQRYVFAYKIACLKNAPLADRIAILEEFKEKEYSEMWAYELAVLYAQAGMREKCVETCDELILWFGDGEYVERALDLKRSFQPLTASQEEKYQRLLSQRGMVEFNIPNRTDASSSGMTRGFADGISPEMTVTASKFNTQNLQEEISKSMQQIVEATEENTVRDQMNSIRKIVQDVPYLEGEEESAFSQREEIQQQVSRELRSDFQEKLVEETTYGYGAAQGYGSGLSDDTSGMSIEEILADWEKMKLVAQQAMAAAEQRKLDLEKEQALTEASAIMRRLEELVPILSATPGEDIPDSSEGTVADELLSSEPIMIKAREPEENEQLIYDMYDEENDEVSPEDQLSSGPLQQVFTRAGHKQGRNPQDPMAGIESLEDWFEDDEQNADDTEEASEADLKAVEASLEAWTEAEDDAEEKVAEVEPDASGNISEIREDDLIEAEIEMPTAEALMVAAGIETEAEETAAEEADEKEDDLGDDLIEVEVEEPTAEALMAAAGVETEAEETAAEEADEKEDDLGNDLIKVEVEEPTLEALMAAAGVEEAVETGAEETVEAAAAEIETEEIKETAAEVAEAAAEETEEAAAEVVETAAEETEEAAAEVVETAAEETEEAAAEVVETAAEETEEAVVEGAAAEKTEEAAVEETSTEITEEKEESPDEDLIEDEIEEPTLEALMAAAGVEEAVEVGAEETAIVETETEENEKAAVEEAEDAGAGETAVEEAEDAGAGETAVEEAEGAGGTAVEETEDAGAGETAIEETEDAGVEETEESPEDDLIEEEVEVPTLEALIAAAGVRMPMKASVKETADNVEAAAEETEAAGDGEAAAEETAAEVTEEEEESPGKDLIEAGTGISTEDAAVEEALSGTGNTDGANDAQAETEDEFFDEEEELLDTDEPTAEIDTDQIEAFLMAQTDVIEKESVMPAETPEQKYSEVMTDEIRNFFSYFIPIPGMSEQISQVLCNVANIKCEAITSSRGNVIIQGEDGSGKTMLATDLIKAVQKVMDRENDKIGKISAQALNRRNFSALIPKIAGGYLIVEDAGDLTEESVEAMSKVMECETNGMTLILEDDSAGIRRVMSLNSSFTAKFTEKIRIPIFTIDELVDFGKAYALEQECEIEEMGVLALYNRINSILKVDHPTTLTEVKKIVDEAIEKAESRGIKKLFAKKYNENDFLILHEEDFNA